MSIDLLGDRLPDNSVVLRLEGSTNKEVRFHSASQGNIAKKLFSQFCMRCDNLGKCAAEKVDVWGNVESRAGEIVIDGKCLIPGQVITMDDTEGIKIHELEED